MRNPARSRNLTNWELVKSRGIQKRSVVLHPVMDQYVKITQGLLLQAGYDVDYSTCLNYMILALVFSVGRYGIHPQDAQLLLSFLEDRETIEKIQLEEAALRYRDKLLERAEQEA